MGIFNRMMIDYQELDDSYTLISDMLTDKERQFRLMSRNGLEDITRDQAIDILKNPGTRIKSKTILAHYAYAGPIYIFDTKVTDYWVGHTMARSAKEAARNLGYQYKKEHGWPIRASIILPNSVTMEE